MLPAVQCVPLFFTITPFTLHCIEALQYIGGAWPIKVGLMDRNVLALRKLVHTWSPKLNGDTSNIFACNKWIRLQNFYYFLLLVRYIPNVAKRSIWDQCKQKYNIYWGPTSDRRPTTSHLGKFQTTISARGRPIHFMFGSTMGFSGTADRMALFPVSQNPRWRLRVIRLVTI